MEFVLLLVSLGGGCSQHFHVKPRNSTMSGSPVCFGGGVFNSTPVWEGVGLVDPDGKEAFAINA
jgi:hypothetical protein